MSSTRKEEVKSFFEQPEVYLKFDYNLKLRRETVQHFIGNQRFEKVLDMPCGTGDISVPLLPQFDELVLMDFSANMIAHAAATIPVDQQMKVRLIHTDFYQYGFEDEQYDLVMAIGILAHINQPMEFLKQVARLVKPNGLLITQNTNASAGYTKLIRAYQTLKRLSGRTKYNMNWISERDVLTTLKNEGFVMQQSFRYHQSWLGFSRFFSNEKKYDKTISTFGTPDRPKNQKSGSDVMYLFKKTSY
jgi:ubiquinone/menaquinone biosynthesis C-methylase UbiE